MRTIFISANDTGVGKTWVTAAIALLLLEQGATVSVVKPVETGVPAGGSGDAEWVLVTLQRKAALSGKADAQTLHRYTQPLAPVEAAKSDGDRLDFDALVKEVLALPTCDWRLVEGAGGLAVPMEDGNDPRDWADFAKTIQADYTVLVVEDRLGAISQARLLASYAQSKELAAGWWLNQVRPDADENARRVNFETLSALSFPMWGAQDFKAGKPRWQEAPWWKS